MSIKLDRHYLSNGVFPVFIGGVIWGVSYFIAKASLADLSPLVLAFYVAFLGTIHLGVFYASTLPSLARKLRDNIVLLFCLALTWLSGTICFFMGITYIDLGVATMIEKLQPIFAIALAWLFLSERVTRLMVIFSVVAIIASYFVSIAHPFALDFNSKDIVGIAWLIGAAFSYAVATVLVKHIVQKDIESLEIVFLRYLLSWVMLLIVLFLMDDLSVLVIENSADWLVLNLLALTAWLGCYFYYKGFLYVSVTVGSLLEIGTPMASIALGVIFLDETFSITQIIAIPIMFWAVYKVVIDRPQKGSDAIHF